MKTLLLLRHAKSDWANDSLSDHDRPLNKRGKDDAPRMGRVLRSEGLIPDAIVTSSAVRAASTAKIVAKAAGFEGAVQQDPRLYHADPEAYLEVAAETDDGIECLLLVGHNPGLEELVEALAGHYERMPTAALACFRVDISRWAEIDPDSKAELVAVWRPKEL